MSIKPLADVDGHIFFSTNFFKNVKLFHQCIDLQLCHWASFVCLFINIKN